MLTRWLTFTALLASSANQETAAVTVATTCEVKGHQEVELTLNCGDRMQTGVVQYWHTPFGDLHSTGFHSKLDPVFMDRDGNLVVPNTTTLHSGLYYCLLQHTQGTTLWSYKLHVQKKEAERQEGVSHELFAGAVVTSVLLTFVVGFSAGALSRTRVLRCLLLVTTRLQSPRKQTSTLDSEVTMTTLPPTHNNHITTTTSPPAKPQRSFRSKQREEEEETTAYLEGCDIMREEERGMEEEEEEEVDRETGSKKEEDRQFFLLQDTDKEECCEEGGERKEGELENQRKDEEGEGRRKSEEEEGRRNEKEEQEVMMKTDITGGGDIREEEVGWRQEEVEEAYEQESRRKEKKFYLSEDGGSQAVTDEDECSEAGCERKQEEWERMQEEEISGSEEGEGKRKSEDTVKSGITGEGAASSGRRRRVIRLYQYDDDGQRYGHLPDPTPNEAGPAPRLKHRSISLTRLNAIMATSAGPLDTRKEETPLCFHREI